MNFFFRGGSVVNFLEPDCKTPIGQSAPLRYEELLRATIAAGGGAKEMEDVNVLDYAISQGRRAVWLDLTEAQYRTL